MGDEPITRMRYLMYSAIAAGADPFVALEAVTSSTIEHPEWDMDEKKTYTDWLAGDE